MALVLDDYYIKFRTSEVESISALIIDLMRVCNILRAEDGNLRFHNEFTTIGENEDIELYILTFGDKLILTSEAQSDQLKDKTWLTLKDFISDLGDIISE